MTIRQRRLRRAAEWLTLASLYGGIFIRWYIMFLLVAAVACTVTYRAEHWREVRAAEAEVAVPIGPQR